MKFSVSFFFNGLKNAVQWSAPPGTPQSHFVPHLNPSVSKGVTPHAPAPPTLANDGRAGRIEESMVVSHVLGSACAVAYNPGTRADEWEPFARLVLEASYEACVLAALDNRDRHDGMAGSKKLFLTLLGGDAFGNPQAWILDAIRRALIKFQHEDVDVFLVCYDGVDAGPRALEGELAAM